MQRYICARGVPDHLVGHPHQREGQRRYVGKQKLNRAELDELRKGREGGLDQREMYRDIEEVVPFDAHVKQALSKGGFEAVRPPIDAPNLAAAIAKLEPKDAAPEPTKAEKEAAAERKKARAEQKAAKQAKASGGPPPAKATPRAKTINPAPDASGGNS
jgi:hypothetical protein